MLVNLVFYKNNIPVINGEVYFDGSYRHKTSLTESQKWNPTEIEDVDVTRS